MEIVLANDTRGSVPGEHWGSWRTSANLEHLLGGGGLKVIDRLRLGELQSGEAVWARIEKAGMLVINGEGSIHSHTRTAVSLLQSLKTARERRIPVWLVNHACWNCDDLMRQYDYADFIAVRDVASRGYLAQHGVHAQLAADCCFLSPPAQVRRQKRLLVCSGLRPPDEPTISLWAGELGYQDTILCNDFYPRFASTGAVKSASADECFRLFATAGFVISSSYHGCIFAAIHGVPFLPVRVPGQPPKTMALAVETMQGHAAGICFEGPAYVRAHYAAIQNTIAARARALRRRARFNLPAGRAGAS
jgi:hypothetical protein